MKTKTFAIILVSALTLSACQTLNNAGNTVGSWFDPEKEAAEAAAQSEELGTQSIVAKAASENCPSVEIMADLKQMVQFSNFNDPVPANKTSSIMIENINAVCVEEAEAIAMRVDVTFAGEIGPKGKNKSGQSANFSYPYFIAVTDKDGSILAKEIFAASMTYSKGQDTIKQIETINQLLPKNNKVQNYTVLLGFQLNEEQLLYNRAQIAPAAGEEDPQDNVLDIE